MKKKKTASFECYKLAAFLYFDFQVGRQIRYVLFYPIIHMIGKTDFIHSHSYGVFYNLLHWVYGIITEVCMYMIIR